MVIPEWEMEQIIAAHPELLGVASDIGPVTVRAQQFYLPRCGGYIDILAAFPHGVLIVELKNELVDDAHVITGQIAKYQDEVRRHINCHGDVRSLLISTHGFSREVERVAQMNSVILKALPIDQLLRAAGNTPESFDTERAATLRLFQRRLRLNSLNDAVALLDSNLGESQKRDVESVRHFICSEEHDESGLEELGAAFRDISRRAPIMAHCVFEEDQGELVSQEDKWFWLFYSALDRRANAATFINARRALERNNLFLPRQIVGLVRTTSYENATAKALQILKDSEFPIVTDSRRGELAMPCSIVDAALYLSKFEYSVDGILSHFGSRVRNASELSYIIIKDLRRNIYGVGPRIAAQIVRGLTLKGGWKLSLSSRVHLERCVYNELFAGKARLGLISSPDDYERELGTFANRYLAGDCGIISHVLWFIRKRFCLRRNRCEECPVAGFCHYFRRALLSRSELNKSQWQLHLFDMRAW